MESGLTGDGSTRRTAGGLPGVDETACRAVRREALLAHRMSLPHQISTLLYVFDREDRVLLLEAYARAESRIVEPARWQAAHRRRRIALCLRLSRGAGGVGPGTRSARSTPDRADQRTRVPGYGTLDDVPLRSPAAAGGGPGTDREGRFAFFKPAQVNDLSLPQTDREQIWRLFWEHRGGFFAAHCRCEADGRHAWTLEESSQRRTSNVEHRALESQHGTPHPHRFRRRGDT